MKNLIYSVLATCALFIGCTEKKPASVVVTPANLPVEVNPDTLQSVHPEDAVDTTTVGK